MSDIGGGTALTDDPSTIIPIPAVAAQVMLIPRNFSSTGVVQVRKCPYIAVIRTGNALSNPFGLQSFTEVAQDGDVSTSISLGTWGAAANDRLIVAAKHPFRGLDITIGTANTTDGSLTLKYWDGSSLTSVGGSLVDGTKSGDDPLAVSGRMTWTPPSAWIPASLAEVYNSGVVHSDYMRERLWIAELTYGVAMSSGTSITSMYALPIEDQWAELPSDTIFEDEFFSGVGGWSAIEAKTNTGTANLVVNVGSRSVFDQWR